MTAHISRRGLLGAGAAALACTATAPLWTSIGVAGSNSGPKADRTRTALRTAYDRAFVDVRRRFFDFAGSAASGRQARIRPTHKLDGPRAGLPDIGTMKGSDAWQTWAYLNQLYWNWKVTGDDAVRGMIAAEGRYLLSRTADGRPYAYTLTEMGSDGALDDTIHLHDDAALKTQAAFQIFDATGDTRYFTALKSMIPKIVRRFADPYHAAVPVMADRRPRRGGEPFVMFPHGIAYGPNGDLAKITTSWEVTIALSALAVHQRDGAAEYLAYARQVYARTKAEGRHESGNLWSGVNLKTLRSDQAYFGYPKVGASSISLQGTMAMCVLAARLARLPGMVEADRARYLADIRGFIRSMTKPQEQFGFVTSVMPINGIFLPWEDSWTAYYHGPAFASEVLGIPGIDPGGACAAIMVATGRAALATRTPEGLYTADWAGQLPTAADYGLLPGATGYEDYYRSHPGSHFNSIAGSPQIMTNAQALSAGLSGVVAEGLASAIRA